MATAARKKERAPKPGSLHTGKMLNRSRGGNAAIFLILFLIALFMGLPLFYSVASAFKPPEELYLFPPRFYVVNPTFDNFKKLGLMVSNLWVPFSRYLYNSLFISVVSTALSVFIGAMAAYPFAKHKFVGKNVLWQLIMITLLFSGGVTALPGYIIKAKLGLINTYWVMILPAIAVPLQMFLMRQFMLQIPDALIEAARLDGANEMRIFTTIILPNVKPAWLTVMVLAFQNIWNGSAGGADSTTVIFNERLKMLPAVLSQINAGGYARMGVAAAASLILMLPPMITFLVNQNQMLQTMAHSGIKD